MKKWLWIVGSVFLSVAILVGIFALLSALSPSAKVATDPAEVAQAGPRLWQEKEASQYVPVQRDDAGVWRSVRIPPVPVVEYMLEQYGRIPLNASQAEREKALKEWYDRAVKDAYIGPDPVAYQHLLEREKALLNAEEGFIAPQDDVFPTPPKSVLGVLVEFAPPGGSEDITRDYPVDPSDPSLGCTSVVDTFSSLNVGDDPPPGPLDNFSFHNFDGFTTEQYESAFFGIGPDAGYGVISTTAGTFDLSGISVNNYLLEMSRGTYTTTGDILPDPLTLSHAHEYYGYAEYSEDGDGNCTSPTFSDANARDYAPDVIAAIVDQYGDTIDWSKYDADGDHIIDLLVIIHAGYGFQNGGGEDRLSTSSSSLLVPLQIGGTTTPETDDDYYVKGFNIDPEQLDVGAIQEEFEHQFGLPDFYVTDGSNSNAWWAAHSSGVWGGPLGGTRPVGHNLWQDWVLGWRDPIIVDYNDLDLMTGKMEVNIGRARYTPENTEDGVIVRLPEQIKTIENLAGEGIGWWSDSGDNFDHRVYRDFDLTSATAPITFTFDAYWDIEEDYDYGYFEVSTDDGETWDNLGWELTGSGSGSISFDLSDYAGQSIGVRFRYLTDAGLALPGWWVDNLLLEDASGELYANDLETDFSDWTAEGWLVVPFEKTIERYYMIEWRDDNGFDESLNDPYNFVYSNPVEPPPESVVDRLPATTPGLLVSYRNTDQGFDYALGDALYDPPSLGTKFAHLVFDSHFEPLRFDTTFDFISDGIVGPTPSGRALPGDAVFGFTPTNEWTAKLQADADVYTTTIVETKTWPSQDPVMAFHDSYGYYPGLFYGCLPSDPADCGLYWSDWDASAVMPAKGDYSTRITDPAGNPFEALYGTDIGVTVLGSGNPGDDHVQYGIHVEVVDSSEESGTIHIWNNLFEVEASTETNIAGVLGSTGIISMTIDENIGGALTEPYLVIELPENLRYVDNMDFGGVVPLGDSFESAEQVVEYAQSMGFGALLNESASNAGDVRYLAWTGDDIGTQMGSPPFGFGAELTGLGNPMLKVWFFKNGTELFQEEAVMVDLVGSTIFMPSISK